MFWRAVSRTLNRNVLLVMWWLVFCSDRTLCGRPGVRCLSVIQMGNEESSPLWNVQFAKLFVAFLPIKVMTFCTTRGWKLRRRHHMHSEQQHNSKEGSSILFVISVGFFVGFLLLFCCRCCLRCWLLLLFLVVVIVVSGFSLFFGGGGDFF